MEFYAQLSGFYPVILGKGPWPKLGKYNRLNVQIGKNTDIKHNNGSKFHPQNQVILDCFMPKHKSLSIILI